MIVMTAYSADCLDLSTAGGWWQNAAMPQPF